MAGDLTDSCNWRTNWGCKDYGNASGTEFLSTPSDRTLNDSYCQFSSPLQSVWPSNSVDEYSSFSQRRYFYSDLLRRITYGSDLERQAGGMECYVNSSSQNCEENSAAPKKHYFCHLCYKLFYREGSLSFHVATYHNNDKPYLLEPTLSNEGFVSDFSNNCNEMFFESQRHQSDSYLRCSVCCLTFNSRDLLQSHMTATHVTEKGFDCLVCHKTLRRKWNLTQHMKIHERENVRKTQNTIIAGLPFRNSLEQGEVNDKVTNSHKYSVCQKGQHSEIHTRQQQDASTVCQKASNVSLAPSEEHMKISRKEQCKCVITSEKVLSDSIVFEEHKNTCTQEQTYKCSNSIYPKLYDNESNATSECREEQPSEYPLLQKVFRDVDSISCKQQEKTCVARDQKYECCVCYKVFDDSVALEEHEKACTEGQRQACSVCERCFTNQHHLKVHMKSHNINNGKSYTCPTCKKTFLTRQVLKRHMMIHTGEKPHGCSICEKTFNQASALQSHMRLHTGEKPYRCPICSKAFSTSCAVIVHKRSHSGEKPYLCSTCGKTFVASNLLKRHMKSHLESYKCSFCESIFAQETSFKCHLETHVGEVRKTQYSCTDCGRAYTRKKSLELHMTSHAEHKPFECDTCHKAYATAVLLQRHVKCHTKPRNYVCSVCDKAFASSNEVRRHVLKDHTGERPFRCADCLKGFLGQSDLNRHVKVHTEDKLYKCSVCNKAFKRFACMRRHMSIHTGKKPYKCCECNKVFRELGYLKMHMSVHTGHKPHKCHLCPKAFNASARLKRHLTIHTGRRGKNQKNKNGARTDNKCKKRSNK